MSGESPLSLDVNWSDLLTDLTHKLKGVDPAFSVGVTVLDDPALIVRSYPLKIVHGWPEIKTEMENQCVHIGGIKVCTKVPVIYHRESDLAIIATISFPSINDISDQIKSCIIVAASATVIASAVSFQWEVAGAEMLGLLKACLIAKGVQDVSQITVGVRGDITPGQWH